MKKRNGGISGPRKKKNAERIKKLETEQPADERSVGIEALSAQTNGESRQRAANLDRRSYRGMFCRNGEQLSNDGFSSFEEWMACVHSGRPDERLQYRSMGSDIPSAGGFLVPDQFVAEMLDTGIENEIVRPRCTIWPMVSDTARAPGWDGADHSSSLYGGFAGTWLGEGETATEVDAQFRSIALTAHKLAVFTSASSELVQDSFLSFDSIMNDGLRNALSWFLDYAAINGTGAGQPLGLVNNNSVVSVAKESGQAASTIVWNNICKMYARMWPSGHQNAIWIANNTIIPQLLALTIPVGTGGSAVGPNIGHPVMKEDSGSFSLLGKPIYFTEKAQSLGTAGDIMYVDLSQYVMGLRKEIIIEKSNAVHWTSDKQAYRAIMRADGMGKWNSAITPKNGDTLSWCVTLAARS